MEKFIAKALKFRWIIIILVIVFTGYFGYELKNLRIDADILNSLPDKDTHAALLKRIGAKFGGNSMGVIILETDNVYQTKVLEHVKLVTDTVSEIEGIASVTSITNIINIKRQEEGFEIGKLVNEYQIPETPEELSALKENVLANDMYKGSIVSMDGTSTLVIFTLADGADVRNVANSVIEKTGALKLPEKIYFIGAPMLVNYISDLMKSDLARLLPIALILIAFVLFLSFRSFSGVVLSLLTAVLAIIWSLGIMSVLGYKMSMISNNIPIILMAVGTAYPIHVLNRINQLRIANTENAIRIALQSVLIPVLLAAVTTIIGFFSFIFGAYLDMIVDFGIFTALGTFLACVFSIFFLPALLEVSEYKKSGKAILARTAKESVLSGKYLRALNNLLFKHPKYIFFSWSLLILLGVLGVFSIKRSVDIQDYFKKGNPTRKAEQIMVEKFGGTKPLFVSFKGDMQSPGVLNKMLETGAYMVNSPDVYTTQSVATLIAELNYAVTGIKEIPDSKEKIEQLWFMLEGNEEMQRFVSDELDEGILISKFKSPDNNSKKIFAEYMKIFIDKNSNDDCKIEITGMPFVDITMDQYLINSQIASIIIAIIFVILIVGIVLRSMSSGFYSAIPIASSIIVLFGVMGFANIPLNVATVLVASVAVGTGIDYAIHIISHFNHSFKISGNVKSAIHDTIMISGKAIIINMVSVSAGFLVLVVSDMVPLQYFGILVALSMLTSSLGALILLPVILILVHRKKNLIT